MVEFGIHSSGRVATYQDLRRVWVEAEKLGFDYAWCSDNVVGLFPGAEEAETFDAWSVLGALAEATSRIRIGSLVTPCGRRHPALFAKMTSILDLISGGRLEVGMGPGDHAWQFLPWGMRYDPKASVRIEILREEVEVLKRMWTQERASFSGKYYTIEGAYNSPKPIQKPHPRIWIGLARYGRKLMPRLAAEYADGINLVSVDDDEARERLEIVREYCNDLGRDFDRMRKSRLLRLLVTEEDAEAARRWREHARAMGVSEEYMRGVYERERLIWGPPERAVEELERIIDVGFDQLIFKFGWGWTAGPDAQLAGARVFAREMMPVLRAKYS